MIGPSPLTLHKSHDQGKLVTTTVRDYDLAEVSKLVSPLVPLSSLPLPHPLFESSAQPTLASP